MGLVGVVCALLKFLALYHHHDSNFRKAHAETACCALRAGLIVLKQSSNIFPRLFEALACPGQGMVDLRLRTMASAEGGKIRTTNRPTPLLLLPHPGS